MSDSRSPSRPKNRAPAQGKKKAKPAKSASKHQHNSSIASHHSVKSSGRVINLICPQSGHPYSTHDPALAPHLSKSNKIALRKPVCYRQPFNSALVDTKCERLIKRCMAFNGISLIKDSQAKVRRLCHEHKPEDIRTPRSRQRSCRSIRSRSKSVKSAAKSTKRKTRKQSGKRRKSKARKAAAVMIHSQSSSIGASCSPRSTRSFVRLSSKKSTSPPKGPAVKKGSPQKRKSPQKQKSPKRVQSQVFYDLVSPSEMAAKDADQYLTRVRNRMLRVNREVSQMEKSPEPTQRLTKANLDQLKHQMQESLASVQPRFGCDALDFTEMVAGFKDRVHAIAKEKAWKRAMDLNRHLSKSTHRSCSSRSTRSTQLSTKQLSTCRSKKSIIKRHKAEQSPSRSKSPKKNKQQKSISSYRKAVKEALPLRKA